MSVKVERLRNKYKGERIFLLGNGPSLSKTPLKKIKNEYSFAVNNIYDIFDNTSWRPDFYASNHTPKQGVRKENVEWADNHRVPCFLPESHKHKFQYTSNKFLFKRKFITGIEEIEVNESIRSINLKSIEDPAAVWSKNINEYIVDCATILYTAAQIISYMGFSEIYLLGCDLYDTDASKPYMIFDYGEDPVEYMSGQSIFDKAARLLSSTEYPVRSLTNAVMFKLLTSDPAQQVQMKLAENTELLTDSSHYYDKGYQPNFNNELVNQKMIIAHKIMKMSADKFGFTIYNATHGGHLEVHPRVELEKIVDN